MSKYSCTMEQLNAGMDQEAARLGPIPRRVEIRCARGCGHGRWLWARQIDITTSGHTNITCKCGGTMVVES